MPGDRDVWIFIIAELAMFGAFFAAYMVSRAGDVELFNASQLTLDKTFGALNTVLLLTSSWAVVQSVRAARENRIPTVTHHLAFAITLGVAFMVIKYFEYSAKFEVGLTLMTNDFYMFYFSLTMIHLLHVAGGLVILSIVWVNARNGSYRPGSTQGIETGASYWHMVDILWIFLFSILYMLR